MTDEEALRQLRAGLREVAPGRGRDIEALALDSTLDSLALDSVTVLELVGVLEERTGHTLAPEGLLQVVTLRDLAELVWGSGDGRVAR